MEMAIKMGNKNAEVVNMKQRVAQREFERSKMMMKTVMVLD